MPSPFLVRRYAPTLFGYIVSPVRAAAYAFVSYLPSLVVVVISIIIAYGCTRISRFLFDHLGKGTITWVGFYLPLSARFRVLGFPGCLDFPGRPFLLGIDLCRG